MPPPGGARTSLSGAIAWLTSLGRGTRGPKTNNAAEKPVDVAAASMRGTGGIYWHVFGTRVSQIKLEFVNTAVPWFSFQREIVDRAVLSLKDAGVPSFLIE